MNQNTSAVRSILTIATHPLFNLLVTPLNAMMVGIILGGKLAQLPFTSLFYLLLFLVFIQIQTTIFQKAKQMKKQAVWVSVVLTNVALLLPIYQLFAKYGERTTLLFMMIVLFNHVQLFVRSFKHDFYPYYQILATVFLFVLPNALAYFFITGGIPQAFVVATLPLSILQFGIHYKQRRAVERLESDLLPSLLKGVHVLYSLSIFIAYLIFGLFYFTRFSIWASSLFLATVLLFFIYQIVIRKQFSPARRCTFLSQYLFIALLVYSLFYTFAS